MRARVDGDAKTLQVSDRALPRSHALQQTMNVFRTSFQGAGAAEQIAALEAASDSVSSAGAKMTKDGKDEIEKGVLAWKRPHKTSAWASSSAFGRRYSKYSQTIPRKTLLIRVRELGEAGVTAEYAASDDAQALATLCKRVKVKVDVTEKLSYGTHPVYANLGGMLNWRSARFRRRGKRSSNATTSTSTGRNSHSCVSMVS